jgi:hypothetical protein
MRQKDSTTSPVLAGCGELNEKARAKRNLFITNDMKPKTDPTKTTPVGLARYAQEFFDAAIATDEALGMRPGYEYIAPIPVMYLVGHSIELSLKAYLIFMGVPLDELKKKYGHNLVKCYNEAQKYNLNDVIQLTESDYQVLEVLNVLYSSKQLNYCEIGLKQFPMLGPLQELSTKLLQKIGPKVGYVHPY